MKLIHNFIRINISNIIQTRIKDIKIGLPKLLDSPIFIFNKSIYSPNLSQTN